MHRIDTSGNVLNRFSEGNPAAGQLATRLSAAWFNDVQENLAYLIEQAGLVLAKGDETQVFDAIVAVIASVGAGGGGGGDDVPITRLVNAAGLATGGGALATDITITVPKASGADVLAATDDTKAVTPLALAAGFAHSFASSGYFKLPGGLIIQWGTGTSLANSTTILTLPIAFPNACLGATVEGGDVDNDAQDNNPFVSGRGTTTISVFNAQHSVAVNYIAIGY
jgi:hypothetical protein